MNREQLKKLVMEEMSKFTVDEMDCPSDMPKQDHDHEGRMHRSSLFKMAKYSVELLDMIQDADDLPEWVESKITKAADYLGVVKHYLEADDAREMGALEESALHRAKEDAIYHLAQQAVINIAKTKEFGFLVQKQDREMFIEDSIDAISRLLKSFSKLDNTREMGALEESKSERKKQDIEEINQIMMTRMQPREVEGLLMILQRDYGHTTPLNEDMIEDVFAEVNENFTIYDTVQDAITEDGDHACPQCLYEVLSDAACGCPDLVPEAEYRGRKVKLNKPMRGDVKKFKVFVKDPKTGNIKKVNFGDPNMRIKKSNPKRRKSFRARHNCKNPGPKTKARYWSCRKW